ncbi:MFS transporter [Actinomadura sp. NPDC048955]|uniref:MFS transporter n=1 Tax=Actinomadura sp. NPDC048955 TaxID=3158228 RepID=UPI003411D9C1
MTTDNARPPTGKPTRFTGRQRLILLVLLGAGFMLSVDFSILNVALPKVGDGVGLSRAALPWIASAYALPAAGFTLLCGRLGDLFGRRRLFLAGTVLLTAASLLGGLATNPAMLLTGRALQGLSTALTIPASLSLLTTTFREGATRDRVLGFNGALLSGGFTIGALVGGTLVSLLSWRSAFLINVPVAVAILALTPFLISESRVPGRVRLDVPGAVTVTGGLLAAVYAVIEKDIFAGAAGALLLMAFWLIELRSPAALAPVRILRRPTVRWGNYAGLVVFSMETSMIFMMTLYLQNVLGLGPLATGLVFGVPGLAAVLAGPVAGRLIGRRGYRTVLPLGLAVQTLATIPLIFLGSGRIGLAVLVPALLISFFGHVTSIVAYTVIGTSGLPNGEQGLATGLTTMTQNVAITIGIPIMSAIAATRVSELNGIHLALTVNVLFTLASAALVWIGLRPRPDHSAATSTPPAAAEVQGY